MSTITVETLLSDVKRLVIRLQRHDTAADSLIDQAIALKKKTESQATFPVDPDDAEFAVETNEEGGGAGLWESAPQDKEDDFAISDPRPSSFAVDPASSIQQPENRNITKLQRENKELRLLLEEHQIALDMIMTKYREKMAELIGATTTPRLRANAEALEELRSRKERFAAGIDLMYVASRKDETEELNEIEIIASLESENRGLRELLAISTKLGGSEEDDDRGRDESVVENDVAPAAVVTDVTCISRQLSDEDALNSSNQSQIGIPGAAENSWC